MKVLFIGGTGIISSACSELAIKRGIELYHLNRGKSSSIRPIEGVKQIIADIRNENEAQKALEKYEFDAVVDWIAFVPEHIEEDIRLFRGKTKQLIFISSASIYETPPSKLPVTELTPLYNPIWKYSQDKIACEDVLRKAWETEKFPFTIVRPSHTYDKTLVPMEGGYTVLHRIKESKPVVVHGDGTSIWTLTNHRDFAKGLVGLLGNEKAIGEDFHITSDEWLTWNQIYQTFAKLLGKDADLVHIPSEIIAKYDKSIGDSLLGDKTHSMIFDNSKLKNAVPDFKCEIPFEEGAQEIVEWYMFDKSRQEIDPKLDSLFDTLISDYKK